MLFLSGYGYPVPKTTPGKVLTVINFFIATPLILVSLMNIIDIIFVIEVTIGLYICVHTRSQTAVFKFVANTCFVFVSFCCLLIVVMLS